MSYGQSWHFRYSPPPVAEISTTSTPKKALLKHSSCSDPSSTAAFMQDRDVSAFGMTKIAQNRLLVTTPWMLCNLNFVENTQQFQLIPLGLSPEDPIDKAFIMAGTPTDATFLFSDILQVAPNKSILVLVYQEAKGSCCLVLQPYGENGGSRERLEQDQVPLKSLPTIAASENGSRFFGVVLFRHDSISAFGFTISEDAELTNLPSAKDLESDEFAAFFPHLVNFKHPITEYYSIAVDDYRVIAIGCNNGIIQFVSGKSLCDGVAPGFTVQQYEIDGPVSMITLFDASIIESRVVCSALVGGSVGYAVVFEDPFNTSCEPKFLPDSDYYDSILCCNVADIDLDGKRELLLGSFSNALVAYKKSAENTWQLESRSKWDFFFFGPIYSIIVQDMNGDGVDEIILASTDGIHVLEPDCDVVLQKLRAVISLLNGPQ
ncbi:hypothetical protein THRCLA_10561 [Thraustotheca clavata]|uniref:Uncharacterized protein n=1 Tax=Thraustotheca clavata TaxID=74557 RepID=A0A1V9YKI0_9STRA|nr:hypothetical protein THRCLA_10561 [Thraustotheca clavata]